MRKDTIKEEREFRETREQQADPHAPLHHLEEVGLVFTRRGSVKQGWCLILGAAVMVLFFAILPFFDGVLYWYYLVLRLGLPSLGIAAGLKLIRDARGRPRK